MTVSLEFLAARYEYLDYVCQPRCNKLKKFMYWNAGKRIPLYWSDLPDIMETDGKLHTTCFSCHQPAAIIYKRIVEDMGPEEQAMDAAGTMVDEFMEAVFAEIRRVEWEKDQKELWDRVRRDNLWHLFSDNRKACICGNEHPDYEYLETGAVVRRFSDCPDRRPSYKTDFNLNVLRGR